MGKALADFGLQAAQGAVGGAMGLVFGGIQDKRQLKQAKKLQRIELDGQREMGEMNQQNAMEMWHNTGYGAQMKQLKEAGLNPGLLYGMGGGGGQSTQTAPGNVTGQHAPTGGGEAVAMAGQAMQIGLMRAQKENIEADTENKKADIPVKGATESNIKQDTLNKQAQESLMKLEQAFNEKTFEDRADQIYYEMNEAMYNTGIAEQKEGKIKTERPYELQQIAAKAIGAELENELTRGQTRLTGQQIQQIKSNIKTNEATVNKWIQEVKQGWQQLTLEERKTKVQELMQQVGKDKLTLEQQTAIYDRISKILGSIIPG